MKLRIKDQSLRLRLTRTEVTTLAQQGAVEARTCFGLSTLRYRLEAQANHEAIEAVYEGDEVLVTLPLNRVQDWATGGTVGLYGEQGAGEERLKIAVEKDFRCLDPGRDEDESDHFDHPLEAVGHAGRCDADA